MTSQKANTENIQNNAKEGIDRFYDLFHRYPRSVIDIGAHVGGCACYAIEKGAKNVIAIEADKENFLEMVARQRKNSVENIKFIPLYNAFSSTCHKDINLIIPEKSNSGQRSICYSPDAPALTSGYKINTVETINLDKLLLYIEMLNIDMIDYLKVDIEGAEFKALPMSDKTKKFFSTVNYIDIELHNWSNKDYFDINRFYDIHPEFNRTDNIIKQYLTFLGICGFNLFGIDKDKDYSAIKLMAHNLHLVERYPQFKTLEKIKKELLYARCGDRQVSGTSAT